MNFFTELNAQHKNLGVYYKQGTCMDFLQFFLLFKTSSTVATILNNLLIKIN